jgi:hypothetical protein
MTEKRQTSQAGYTIRILQHFALISQTGCSQTLLICTPNATASGCIGFVLSFVK